MFCYHEIQTRETQLRFLDDLGGGGGGGGEGGGG